MIFAKVFFLRDVLRVFFCPPVLCRWIHPSHGAIHWDVKSFSLVVILLTFNKSDSRGPTSIHFDGCRLLSHGYFPPGCKTLTASQPPFSVPSLSVADPSGPGSNPLPLGQLFPRRSGRQPPGGGPVSDPGHLETRRLIFGQGSCSIRVWRTLPCFVGGLNVRFFPRVTWSVVPVVWAFIRVQPRIGAFRFVWPKISLIPWGEGP